VFQHLQTTLYKEALNHLQVADSDEVRPLLFQYNGSLCILTNKWSGISDNIQYLYTKLIDQYDRGDLLYFLGFSRGAYTVRCLLDFVATIGILDRSQVPPGPATNGVVKELFDTWKSYAMAPSDNRQLPHPQYAVHKPENLEACAVWDTVSSIGPPRVSGMPMGQNPYKRVADALPMEVRFGFQALALNERRENFRPMVWPHNDHNPTQHINQCWFIGPHSAVGGGSNQMANNIANATLRWMCAQLESLLGVGIDHGNLTIITQLPPRAVLNGILQLENSFKGPMMLAGSYPRLPGYPNNENQKVHISVRRWDRYLTLNHRPTILDNLFKQGIPEETPPGSGVFQWTTIPRPPTMPRAVILPEDQPSAAEYIADLIPSIQAPGPGVTPGAPGGAVPSHGNPTLQYGATQPPITYDGSYPGNPRYKPWDFQPYQSGPPGP
jgi:hypothetical protein